MRNGGAKGTGDVNNGKRHKSLEKGEQATSERKENYW